MSGVVAAQIVSVENHPESHKLHLLKVDAGDRQLTDVVCGAPTLANAVFMPSCTFGAPQTTSVSWA